MSQQNDSMLLTIIATTLSRKYDVWSKDDNVMNVLDTNTNSICIYLKNTYPYIEDSTAQSISFAFLVYLYMLVSKTTTRLPELDVD